MKKRLIASAVVAFLLIAGGVAWMLYSGVFAPKQNQGTTQPQDTTLDQAEAIKVTSLTGDGKYDEALAVIDANGGHATPGSTGSILYAQVIAKKGDVDGAVKLLRSYEDGSTDAFWYRGKAATILADAGRKQEAIQYYKDSLQLAESTTPANDQDQMIYNDRLSDITWNLEVLEGKHD